MTSALRIAFTIISLAATAATAAPGQSVAARDTLAFTISLRAVRLVLPVGHRDRWHWRLPETPDNRREYGWEVVLGVADTRGFGFSLYKIPWLPADSGTLGELLRAGQRGVWEESAATHLGRLVREARIVLGPTESGVAVTITDPWTIDFLFGPRPLVGTLVLQNPGREYTSIPLRFAYVPE